jgi:hypothetical protein
MCPCRIDFSRRAWFGDPPDRQIDFDQPLRIFLGLTHQPLQDRAPRRLSLSDGRRYERSHLRKPLQAQLLLLVHPEPHATLPNDALVVSEVEPVEHELGALAPLRRNVVGHYELHRGQQDLEPLVADYKRVDKLP